MEFYKTNYIKYKQYYKDYYKKYREANKERINNKNKEYNKKNRELIKQYKHDYYEKNKKKLLANRDKKERIKPKTTKKDMVLISVEHKQITLYFN